MDQNDIDAMLNQMPTPPSAEGDAAPDAAQAGGMSQSEINAGMNIAPDDAAASTATIDDVDRAMAAALAEEGAAGGGRNAGIADYSAEAMPLPSFEGSAAISEVAQPLSMLHDVQLHVKIELGRTQMFVEDVLKLGEGSVVELDRLAGDPVDVYVNNRLVARGEVLVLNDNFCVRVSEIIAEAPAHAVP